MKEIFPTEGHQVFLVSPDGMVNNVLHGVLSFHGYGQAEILSPCQVLEVVSHEPKPSAVFMDMAYIKTGERKDFQECMTTLVRMNVPVILLVESDWGLYVSEFFPVVVRGVLQKPLDCHQIERIMHDIATHLVSFSEYEVGVT